MKARYQIILAMAAVMGFASVSFSLTDMPNDKPGIINWLKDKLGGMTITEVLIQETTVYCKVIDQNGDPVPGAQMETSRLYTVLPDFYNSVGERKFIAADDAGQIKFDIKLHQDNDIEGIKKKGYEPGHFTASAYYGLSREQKDELFKNSVNSPLVFILRKLGPTTYLYHVRDGGWYLRLPSTFVAYDIFEGCKKIDRDLTKLRYPQRYDLVLDATKADSNYTVRITPVQQTGSVQILDQYLREAPASGYQPEATINIGNGENRTTYLYFISRNPGVYSRMKIEMVASEEKLTFSYDTWTNPYGSRNLEYEPDLPWSLESKLEKEAEAALKSGKLPPEPNIPQLIASGKYN